MDAPAPPKPVKINRWLPYWAVFQADIQATMRSWVYRTWVMVSVLAAVGYLLYRVGAARESGIVQPASTLIAELLRWAVLGNVTLVLLLTTGSISSERGSLADSVLSRGISRWGYFLGKWHARLFSVLGTYLLITAGVLVGSFFLLHDDLSLMGILVALATVTALLAAVVTSGVTISAMTNSTILGMSILWVLLYGSGFALTLVPGSLPTPDRILNKLPSVLQGNYDLIFLGRLVGYSALASVGLALVGMISFSRRDV